METQKLFLPEIITANTFYWNPAQNASSRRRNENRRLGEVEEFLKKLGFKTTLSGDRVEAQKENIEVNFHYSESCKNVYKSFSVYKDGKRSNISLIKKFLN